MSWPVDVMAKPVQAKLTGNTTNLPKQMLNLSGGF
jgi:hypothetical protein